MICSCAYFLYTDGIFSYAGFASLEVVAISTLMLCLLLLDAMSTCKCHTAKKAPYLPHKVATGAEYESEDDEPGKKLMKKRREGGEEFGADESMPYREDETMAKMRGTQVYDVRSQASNKSAVDEETKRQIAMLEELAR